MSPDIHVPIHFKFKKSSYWKVFNTFYLTDKRGDSMEACFGHRIKKTFRLPFSHFWICSPQFWAYISQFWYYIFFFIPWQKQVFMMHATIILSYIYIYIYRCIYHTAIHFNLILRIIRLQIVHLHVVPNLSDTHSFLWNKPKIYFKEHMESKQHWTPIVSFIWK